MNGSYIAALTNDKYFPGLCALAYSLKKVGAKYPLSVVVPRSMPAETKHLIAGLDLPMIEMDEVALDDALLKVNSESRWNATMFKLSIFNLTQFDKIVFLDLDMIILKNIDELFDCPHMSSVAAGQCANPGWTRLNSGLIVIEPSAEVYAGLISCCVAACRERIAQGVGFGDQDVINYYYPDWGSCPEINLPEIYNGLSVFLPQLDAKYGYENLKVLHFAEYRKPWQYTRKNYCVYLVKRILKGEWVKFNAIRTYRKFLRASCPGFLRFL